MNVEVAAVPREQAEVLGNLMQLYLYEFTDIDWAEGSDLKEIGADGKYTYHYFDAYWAEPGRDPYLILADGKLAGFALVLERRLLDPDHEGHAIAEFFVLRNMRRRGIGEAAARFLFERYPGEWEVAELEANQPAQHFWRVVIGRYSGGGYDERRGVSWGQRIVVQRFRAPGR